MVTQEEWDEHDREMAREAAKAVADLDTEFHAARREGRMTIAFRRSLPGDPGRRLMPMVVVPRCLHADGADCPEPDAPVPVYPESCTCTPGERLTERDWSVDCPDHGRASRWVHATHAARSLR